MAVLGLPAGADRGRAQPRRLRDRRLSRQPARPRAAARGVPLALRARHRARRGASDRRDRRGLAGGGRARRRAGVCSAPAGRRRGRGRSPSPRAARCSWSRSRSGSSGSSAPWRSTPPVRRSLRTAVQRSAILRALNNAFPPSSSLINVLHRIDPRVAVQGPSPDVAAPDSKIARDPDVQGGLRQRGAGARHGLRPRGRGIGLDRGPGPGGHQRARGRRRERHHRHARPARAAPSTRPPSTTTPRTTSRCSGSTASAGRRSLLRAGRAERAPREPFSAIRRTDRSRSPPLASARPAR